ncbi:cell wall-binding repeat-containing protein [Herbiconiux ginsengi]|uniref:Putative cell wall binding repeat 2 n=1 Tax=Herbiconiux ginsengi TaxID=381665 RepID=A0A1H3TL64_9MICO|nr:cell wall-binding repeat-containing protein [Herbiconiux ginsengi]SDZ50385.1 Putative cell wall binding repeat 2 [Herbiconiux ginsengi]
MSFPTSSRRLFTRNASLPRAVSLGVFVVLTAVLAGGALSPAQAVSSSQAVPGVQARYAFPTPTRIQGVDRYDQAIKISSGYGRSDVVYLASGEKFADALSTAAVAGRHGAPLLLTPPDAVPENVVAELLRLKPTTIVLVGGPASVSDAAMEQLSQRISGATTVRIGGADRYEVSRNLLAEPTFGAIRATTVFAVTGATFPDALTASPAAVHTGLSPVLLLDGSQSAVKDADRAVLNGLGASNVHLVGGVNSLSVALQNSLGGRFTVTRSDGADRYEAGANVNRTFYSSASKVYLASGTTFPDALSGGPLAAKSDAPLYVVQPNCIPGSVLVDMTRLNPREIIILGGPNTLGPGVDALTPC